VGLVKPPVYAATDRRVDGGVAVKLRVPQPLVAQVARERLRREVETTRKALRGPFAPPGAPFAPTCLRARRAPRTMSLASERIGSVRMTLNSRGT